MMGLLQPDCPSGPLRTILLRLLELQTGGASMMMMNRDTNLLVEEDIAVDRMLYHPQMAGMAWRKGRVTKLVVPRDGMTTMSRKEEEDDLHGGEANADEEVVPRNAPSTSNAVPFLLLDAQDGHVPYYRRRRRVDMAAELVVVVVGDDDDDVPSPQPLPYPLVLPRRIQDSLGFQC